MLEALSNGLNNGLSALSAVATFAVGFILVAPILLFVFVLICRIISGGGPNNEQ